MRIFMLWSLVACGSAHPSPPVARLPEQPSPVARPAPDAATPDTGTPLRTRPFKYAAYLERFKAQIAAQWRPDFDPHDPETIVVRLRVEILVDGNLGKLWIEQSSGIASEDAEAIRSVRAAAPFEPPPLALSSWPLPVTLAIGPKPYPVINDEVVEGRE